MQDIWPCLWQTALKPCCPEAVVLPLWAVHKTPGRGVCSSGTRHRLGSPHGCISLLSSPEAVQVGLTLPSLLSVEISDTSLRPVLLTQPRKVTSVVVHVSPDPSGDLPFLPSASRASAQRRKRSVPYGQGRGGPWWGTGAIAALGFSRWLLSPRGRIHLPGPRSERVGMVGSLSVPEPVHTCVLGC